jgi:hypothetical protein
MPVEAPGHTAIRQIRANLAATTSTSFDEGDDIAVGSEAVARSGELGLSNVGSATSQYAWRHPMCRGHLVSMIVPWHGAPNERRSKDHLSRLIFGGARRCHTNLTPVGHPTTSDEETWAATSRVRSGRGASDRQH